MSTDARPLALLVDDEEPDRLEMATLLAREGFSVQEARHGREALDQLQHSEFSVIVLDILMPIVDGFEVVKHLRAKRPELLNRTLVVSRVNLEDLKVFFPEVRVVQKPPREQELLAVLSDIREAERGRAV